MWIHFVGYPCHFSSRSKLCEVHISMRDAGQTTWRKPLQLTAMSSGRACRLTLPRFAQWHSWSMLKFLLKLVSFDFKLKLVKGSRRIHTDPEGSKRPCSSRRGSNSGDVPCRSRPLELLALQVFEMGLWFATSPASNSRDGWHSHNFIQFLCYSGRSSGHAFWKHAQIKERVALCCSRFRLIQPMLPTSHAVPANLVKVLTRNPELLWVSIWVLCGSKLSTDPQILVMSCSKWPNFTNFVGPAQLWPISLSQTIYTYKYI